MRFNTFRICLALSCMLALCWSAVAQPGMNMLRLSAERRGLADGFTPFGTVEMLDNRFDTVTLYSFQDGSFPPSVLKFDGAAADEIGQYLQDAINTLHHGSDTLLVNLRQLRMTNKNIRLKKDDTISAYRLRDLRLGFLLVADIYRRKGELYYPLGTFGKLYSPGYYNFAQTIAFGLNEMLTVAGGGRVWYNRKKEDVLAFHRSTNTNGYTLAQINIKAQDNWAHYPVMEAPPAGGLFMEWDDFQNNRARKDDFHLAYDERDNLYHLSVSHKVKSYPWAVSDSGELYIHVLREVYVKSWRCHNTRCFYIPRTLPDMYTLLSVQTGARTSSGMGYSGGSSGNLLVDLGAIFVAASIDAIIMGSAERKLKKRGLRSDYRYCYIDMDYGDIIYSDTIPDL
jgi:hypothetical protein